MTSTTTTTTNTTTPYYYAAVSPQVTEAINPAVDRRLASAMVHCAGSATYQFTDPEP